jgi:hypothetical protein
VQLKTLARRPRTFIAANAVRGQPLKPFLAQQLLADHLIDQRLGLLCLAFR